MMAQHPRSLEENPPFHSTRRVPALSARISTTTLPYFTLPPIQSVIALTFHPPFLIPQLRGSIPTCSNYDLGLSTSIEFSDVSVIDACLISKLESLLMASDSLELESGEGKQRLPGRRRRSTGPGPIDSPDAPTSICSGEMTKCFTPD